jgi:16S rRNA (guanine527-N7)-methyltransferase
MSTERRLERLRQVAGPVSRETFERLLAFEGIIQKWSRKINLVSSSAVDQLWERHILDSAQLVRMKPEALSWLDMGSGAGFPGIVLAVLLADRPGSRVDLIEANTKKVSFLRAALSELGLSGNVHNARIEACQGVIDRPQIVTARALASLNDLLSLAEPWLMRGATGLFHKGRDFRVEVENSAAVWRYRLVQHPSLTEPGSAILEVSEPVRRHVSNDLQG